MFNRSSAMTVMVLLFMVALLAAGAFAATEAPAKPDNPQAKTAGDETIPTLTEWGMIIFSVMLFGWMAWMVVRRKRATEVGM